MMLCSEEHGAKIRRRKHRSKKGRTFLLLPHEKAVQVDIIHELKQENAFCFVD